MRPVTVTLRQSAVGIFDYTLAEHTPACLLMAVGARLVTDVTVATRSVALLVLGRNGEIKWMVSTLTGSAASLIHYYLFQAGGPAGNASIPFVDGKGNTYARTSLNAIPVDFWLAPGDTIRLSILDLQAGDVVGDVMGSFSEPL